MDIAIAPTDERKQMSEVRRSFGVGLARRAEEFAEAAEHLITKKSLGPVSLAFLFLVGHALELAYKSVLLNHGTTEDELKKIGHDLVKSREGACARFPGELAELEEGRNGRNRCHDLAILQGKSF